MCGAADCHTCHPELDWPRLRTRKPQDIRLDSKVDQYKGNWFLWSCIATMPDGTEIEGTVQADGRGNLIAEDTFEAD